MTVSRLLLASLLASLAACSDGSGKWGPGTLTATLESPNGAEGAAVLLLVGDGVRAIRALGGVETYAGASTEGTRLVVIDRAGGTLSFEVTIEDLGRPPLAVVEQVAGPDDELRADLSGYRVELRR